MLPLTDKRLHVYESHQNGKTGMILCTTLSTLFHSKSSLLLEVDPYKYGGRQVKRPSQREVDRLVTLQGAA